MRIAVIGAGGHAHVVIDIVRKRGEDQVVGVLDTLSPLSGRVFGVPTLRDEDELLSALHRSSADAVIVAIGDNWARGRVTRRLQAATGGAVRLATAIHPSAQIGQDSEIGAGSVIAPGAIVGPGSRIGEGCIVNTGAAIDHDSTMGDYASLAPGVTAGGNVVVGEFSAVCIGATLSHKIVVGPHSVVGAGAVVLRDVPDHVVAWGIPARVVHARVEGERYL